MKKHKIQQNILTRLLKKAAKYREMDNKILADAQLLSRLVEQRTAKPSGKIGEKPKPLRKNNE